MHKFIFLCKKMKNILAMLSQCDGWFAGIIDGQYGLFALL